VSDKSRTHNIDAIGWKILTELQENARIPFAELARRVGLSTPAAAERVRKLEDEGVITGYRTEIDMAKVGLPVLAFVRVNLSGDELLKFPERAARRPEVIEIHRVTGSESFVIKIAVADNAHLQEVLDSLMPYISTTTSIVLTSFLSSRSVPAQTTT
jgi:Lrp/AsnC family leucine-responsive transcriptional regulator